MDFGALPPEINSARMYSGAGAGPMLAAANAWDRLSGDLHSAAMAYSFAVSQLTSESWLGPSSVSMTRAADQYVTWLNDIAAQTLQTATQARQIANAFHDAYVSTAPPWAVSANRTELATLMASNFIGQNAAAIAANEARYYEMWAQDAVAMYSYAARAASASSLPVFVTPPQLTNPGASSAQAGAVAQSTASSSGSSTTQVMSQLTTALAQLASPLQQSTTPPILESMGVLGELANDVSGFGFLGESGIWSAAGIPFFAEAAVWIASGGLMLAESGPTLATSTTGTGISGSGLPPASLAASGAANNGFSGNAPAVSADTARASLVRGLSVPAAWASSAPEMPSVSLPAVATGGAASAAAVPGLVGALPVAAGSAGSPRTGSRAVGRHDRADGGNADGDWLYNRRRSQFRADEDVAGAFRELDELREQNIHLKRLLAEAELEKDALRKSAKGRL